MPTLPKRTRWRENSNKPTSAEQQQVHWTECTVGVPGYQEAMGAADTAHGETALRAVSESRCINKVFFPRQAAA